MPKKITKKAAKKAGKKVVKQTRERKTAKSVIAGLSFKGVVDSVARLHTDFVQQTAKAVNASLTLRNWLIGAYIHEYELRGADRAKYGENILTELASSLTKQGVPGCAPTNLYTHLRFYREYPQIFQTLSGKLQRLGINRVMEKQIFQTLSEKLRLVENKGIKTKRILETESPKLQKNSPSDDIPRHTGQEILEKLSYSHLLLLLGIDDSYQRAFYEMECMRGNWSVRELKRQISSLHFERTALSTNRKKLREIVKQRAEVEEPRLIIRDPMVFEFIGIKPSEVMLEEELEQRLLDKLQETLLELGRGFCFEARQKRLLIGGEHFFVDLVFYHRILRCHVLIELKDDEFRHEHLGQLNTYVSWYKKNMMAEGDEPPVGILLCTGKNQTLVEYALAGMSNNLFVSRYLAQLPTREELLRIAQECRD